MGGERMTKTAAAIQLEVGRPMVVDEIELPDPGPTQVLVRQFASGVCHSQLHELHSPIPRWPLILGHESTGEVVAKGREVSHLQEGDHVLITWVARQPGDTAPVPVPAQLSYRGEAVHYGAPAATGVFTWAESVLVDQQFAVKVPERYRDARTDVTSIIGCAVMTGCGAVLNSAGVRANNSVAVFGSGGVGLCIIQAAANAGAYPVIAVDLSDEKVAFAKRFGATHGVNGAREDAVARVQELTDGGVDFAFDAIGVASTMEQILLAARPGLTGVRDGGTAVLVGVPHGDAPNLQMRMLFGGKIYRGAPGGSSRPDRDFPMYLRWFSEGKLPLTELVTRRYRLEQINEACTALERGEIAGRAIVEF
jgi:Zn-dependent alcohol dehydrogenase